MSREIKFRFYNTKEKSMTVQGDAVDENRALFWAKWETTPHVTDPMQCTGLKDVNGIEIYEGDIVRVPEFYETPEMANTYYINWQVEFSHGQWNLTNKKQSAEVGNDSMYVEYNRYDGNFEIIGNTYQNPELLTN